MSTHFDFSRGFAFLVAIIATGTASSTLHSEERGVTTTSSAETTTTIDWRQSTEDISQLAARYNAPSVSVAVIKDNEIIYTHALGLQDIASGTTATTATQYGIGSIVKSFSSALVGSMIEDGLLRLDDSPAKLIEGLELPSTDLTQNLRVSHLLSQTSGLPFMDGSLAFFPEADQIDLVERLAYFDASCRVGDCWSYNNLNFVLLDMIVESITGKSKTDLLAERLLQPADLQETLSSTDAFKASPNAATGYGMSQGQPQAASVEYLYGEHIYTTASDLARWLDVWMSDGKGLFPTEYAHAAIATQAIEDGSPPSPDAPGIYLFGYGFGWQTMSFEGHYPVRHGGNENGFTAHSAFIPAQRLGVVTLTNQQNSILPNIVNDLLMRQLLGLDMPAISDYPVNVSNVAALISEEEAKLAWLETTKLGMKEGELVGDYTAEGYGLVSVRVNDMALMLTTPAWEFVLVPQGNKSFGLASVNPVPLGIVMDFFQVEFGPDRLSMNIAAEPVVFTRIE
jgi:CubicO group peptidase (beta-lactamase class C family)